jgi:hypothetical protein
VKAGKGLPSPMSTSTWHRAKAIGLPKRYITSITADRGDPHTVYVTLAGYSRRWLAPGVLGEQPDQRAGHVFKSTDAGDHFTDISANLPDAPVDALLVYRGHLVVGTETGVYISENTTGGRFEVLGNGLPNVPVFSVSLKPKAKSSELDTLMIGTHGRSMYSYGVPGTAGLPEEGPPKDVVNPRNGGLATTGFRWWVPLSGLCLVAVALLVRRRTRHVT